MSFSDEKNFFVDPSYNAQNDRWIRIDATDYTAEYQATTKHAASAMFLGVVASTWEVFPLCGSNLDLGLIQPPTSRPSRRPSFPG